MQRFLIMSLFAIFVAAGPAMSKTTKNSPGISKELGTAGGDIRFSASVAVVLPEGVLDGPTKVAVAGADGYANPYKQAGYLMVAGPFRVDGIRTPKKPFEIHVTPEKLPDGRTANDIALVVIRPTLSLKAGGDGKTKQVRKTSHAMFGPQMVSGKIAIFEWKEPGPAVFQAVVLDSVINLQRMERAKAKRK